MARHADSQRHRWIRVRWLELVARMPGRGEFALRLALISSITTWVVLTYDLPDAALTAYVVFFMNRPDRTSSILTSTAMTVLISLVIGLLFLIARTAIDEPALRVTIMAGLSLFMLFLASASKLKPLASTISLILAYALDLLGKVPAGELATRALLYAWLMIGIPAGVSILINFLIGPSPWQLATRAIALRLRAAQALMLAPGPTSRNEVSALRSTGATSIHALSRLSALERTRPQADILAIQQATHSIDVLLMVVEAIDAQNAPSSWCQEAAMRLGEMAEILERGLYPLDIQPVLFTGESPDRTTGALLGDFNTVLATFAVEPPLHAAADKAAKSGFFVADAWSNPEHVRYAVKVTAAAMICYLFYSLSDWPGIHTCLITCYIVALSTTAETVEKMALRITGALVGAALGLAAIVWVVPSIDDLVGLLVLVFGGGLLGGWIAAGSPRIAYAGFQVTFAFFLCVIQGSSPAFDLTVPRDRVVGILIGNAVVYVLFVYVWPVSIAGRINAATASLLRQMAQIARLPEQAVRRDRLPAAHASVASLTINLDIAAYEPASIRPQREWFRQRRELIATASDLEFPLLASGDRARLDDMAAHLERLADDMRADDAADGANRSYPGGHNAEQDIAR